ncbi:MAG: peptidoglycan-binding protein [Gammaproteobacteria bacterium]
MKSQKIYMVSTGIITLVALASLSACGHTKFDRGMGGAMVGTATGATVGAVTGMTIAQGAVLGAAGGAIVGLATDSNQINLGKPFWRDNASENLYKPKSKQYSSVRQIQSGLAAKGYHPGPSDGIAGRQTRKAIRDYQRDNGLLVNGQPSPQLVSHIQGY